MLSELDAHSRVTVREASLGDALPEEEHAGLAKALGIPLTAGLSAYLGFANGVRLDWQIDGAFGGSIRIGDLSLLRDPSSHYLGEEDGIFIPTEAYGKNVADAWLPFDFYEWDEGTFELAGLLPDGERLDVFVSDDEIACTTNALLLGFGEYIDLILRAYGSSFARAALIMRNGVDNHEGARAEVERPGILRKDYELSTLVALIGTSPDVDEVRAFFAGGNAG